MEIFLNVLHGAYAYLLIFQILVVTLLLLALLWLIVRRTKEAGLYGGSVGATTFGTLSGTMEANQTTGAAAYAAGAASGAAAANVASSVTSSQLQEKVKYLESKLLEYEILQEEISTLSALKVENEELRKKLMAGGTPVESRSASEPLEVGAAEPAALLDDQTPEEEASETEKPKSVLEGLATEPATEIPSELINGQPEPVQNSATTPEQAELMELENLLSKIDELTKEASETTPADPTKPSKAL